MTIPVTKPCPRCKHPGGHVNCPSCHGPNGTLRQAERRRPIIGARPDFDIYLTHLADWECEHRNLAESPRPHSCDCFKATA